MKIKNEYDGLEIAVIGMSGQFPMSKNHMEYWENLKAGNELMKTLTDEELRKAGVPESTLQDELYVKSAGVLENKGLFDFGFFGYTAEEAALMDPQSRLFHQHCWSALEDSGYSSMTEKYKIGLYAGSSSNDNWKIHAFKGSEDQPVDPFFLKMIATNTFISTLISYKLNLRGPSIYLDTACSTSLVAVHMACRALLTKDCNIALAGAVSVSSKKQKGYFYEEGMISSKDGHCRTFDIQSSGTTIGEGLGVVVLKKLSEAIRDKDHIYSVIKSTAINNDGNNKVGYTAPSVKGQVECILAAQKLGSIDPKSISYVEAHGTATKLGDPIEIHSLNEAFGTGGDNKFCAIGSVKTNMGHLDAAAGVAGLMKTVLSLKNKQIPASLHFTAPNPEIDFDGGPFYVNTALKEWVNVGNQPLRAAVSSLGIGGTNAHVILEEAPQIQETVSSRKFKLVTISAKTKDSVARYLNDLNNFLKEAPSVNLSDMSYTLQIGRKHFGYRKSIVYENLEDLTDSIDRLKSNPQISRSKDLNKNLVFMFPGAGAQYVNMGKDLYETEELFRNEMDKGFDILKELTGLYYKDIFYPKDESDLRLNDMLHTQPCIFLFGYALARLIMSYRVTPKYMIGHSIGEYVAACISGVFSFEDTLKLVVKRGELISSLPPGSMISVFLPATEAEKYLDENISLAAVNGFDQIVFSGITESIDALTERLDLDEVMWVKLHATHAGHSHMTDRILGAYENELSTVTFNEPSIPFLSGLTGDFIKKEEAMSIIYWSRHMRETVKFSSGIEKILSKNQEPLFIEIGGGHSLTTLLKQIRQDETEFNVLNLVRHPKHICDDTQFLTNRIGELWAHGVDINWDLYYGQENRRKISLPTYSFEHTRFLAEIDPFENTSMSSMFESFPLTSAGVTFNQEISLNNGEESYVIEKLERPYLTSVYKEAETETEVIITTIFEDFFGITGIGTEDDFFEMGGDSLKGMRLLKRITNKFGVKLSLKDFFMQANIKAIALSIDNMLWFKNDIEMENEIKI